MAIKDIGEDLAAMARSTAAGYFLVMGELGRIEEDTLYSIASQIYFERFGLTAKSADDVFDGIWWTAKIATAEVKREINNTASIASKRYYDASKGSMVIERDEFVETVKKEFIYRNMSAFHMVSDSYVEPVVRAAEMKYLEILERSW